MVLEIENFLSGMGSSNKNTPTIFSTSTNTPLQVINKETMRSVAGEIVVTILKCECGKDLSVGKMTNNKEDIFTLACPSCKRTYKQEGYVVDPNSKVFHRPFDTKAEAQFDIEIENIKKTLKFDEKLLK